MTTEEMPGLGDPVIRRVQRAFAHEEPATELTAIVQRAGRYQAGEPAGAHAAPTPQRELTATDLAAARRREPAAVTRVYTAYAPALFRFFMAAVTDRHLAEDLTGTAFLSAIEALPRFRGPVEALGGWLFQIARHDLYDYRRKQARSRIESLEDNLDEAALADGGVDPNPPGEDWAADALLNRLSPREREVLALLGRGWSDAQIGRELYISPHTVRTHEQNLFQKLEMHSKLEAASLAMQHGWFPTVDDPDELATARLESAQVLGALRQLASDQREVLLLHMSGGLTIPEVAAVLGKSTGEVKALWQRGLASLARVLGSPDLDHGLPRPPPPGSPSHHPSPGP
jgi:RNA polymerase sigma factor (sigma-70 family)